MKDDEIEGEGGLKMTEGTVGRRMRSGGGHEFEKCQWRCGPE